MPTAKSHNFGKNYLRASPVVLYHKPESGKRWKDVNCGSSQQGESMYSSFIYRLKPGFGRFFRGACNRFWNVLLWEDSRVWENNVLMITGLQAYKMTRDALRASPQASKWDSNSNFVWHCSSLAATPTTPSMAPLNCGAP
jgi:hypothetical protein